MASIPISDVDNVVQAALEKIAAGAAAFSKARNQGVRIPAVEFTMDIIVDGAEVVQSRQTSTQDAGSTTTTTTEQPFSQVTTTVKTGSYTQAGTNASSQGGGSSETTDYTYDEVI